MHRRRSTEIYRTHAHVCACVRACAPSSLNRAPCVRPQISKIINYDHASCCRRFGSRSRVWRYDSTAATARILRKCITNSARALFETIRRQSFGTQTKNRSACCVCLVKTNADAHAHLMVSVRAATQPNAGGVPGARHSHMFMARKAAQAHAPVPVGLPATTDPRDAITD